MTLPDRSQPPIIILKLDDVSQQYGKILPSFQRMAEMLQARRIKASFGVICAVGWPGAQSLAESGPQYIQWVRQLHASGMVEFWFHGWDHATHDIDGQPHCEFHQRSYAEQKQRFDRGQKMAMEKFGFPFRAFGPGGAMTNFPLIDQATLLVVADDPYINVIFYPTPIDVSGRQLAAQGKVMVLNRIPGVSLEKSTGLADFHWFMQGYATHPQAEYFVLQGHPNPWDEAKFTEVTNILDFLLEQNAVFMTPSEFAAAKGVKSKEGA